VAEFFKEKFRHGIFFHLIAVCNDKGNEAIAPIDFSISSAVIDIGSV